MRVISGKYRGRRWDIPRTFKSRPTTDFAKENLFNVLLNLIDFETEPTALDLFAGTGSIGLELLSRGCSQVTSVEKDYRHYTFIRQIRDELKAAEWQLIQSDALRYISRCNHSFDIVFADPPYALKELGEIPPLVFASGILNSGGIFILEHGKEYDFSKSSFFMQHREYGSVNFTLFTQPSPLL